MGLALLPALSTRPRQTRILDDIPCGGHGWIPVVLLDLSDPNQGCPSPWRELTQNNRRMCESLEIQNYCDGPSYPVGTTYSRVCGRVTGFATDVPYAFFPSEVRTRYLDGVSITHSSLAQHIWSFGASHASPTNRCPCENSALGNTVVPAFVGNNYFCETRDKIDLWDGVDCNTACCTFNSPPWFDVTLPKPTSADIEVNICSIGTVGADEDTFVQYAEIYIQ